MGRRLGLLVGACVVLGPGTAAAATVSVGDGRLVVTAGAGESNVVVVESAGDGLRVFDAATPPVAGAGCAAVPDVPSAVTCDAAVTFAADLGDGKDRLELRAALPADVDGGPGDDVLHGSPVADILRGGPGDDQLVGGDGEDTLIGGDGADEQDGGPGRDTVRYDDGLHDAGVAVSLSGGQNDGTFAELDEVRGVEVVYGSAGPDAVRGTDGSETVFGGAGDDAVDLLGGDDVFDGGPGDDSCLLDGLSDEVCDGGPGDGDIAAYRGTVPQVLSLDGVANDGRRGATGNLLGVEELVGGEGDDVLVGGPGDEMISGRGGDDILRGGPGDDVLAGDRGADVVEGGPGTDRVGCASIFVGGPVRVTLDKLPNDGEGGERDRIGRDVEIVEGTTTGADLLAAGEAGATLRGLGGEDRLVGGVGPDVLEGGAGGDRIAALDGVRDEIRCGPGLDLVVSDPQDVLRDCERIGRQRPVLRVMRRAPMVLRLRCPVVYRAPVRPYARVCRGAVLVRRGRRVLRRLEVDAEAGRPRALRGPAVRPGDVLEWRFDGVRTPVVSASVGA